MGAVGVKVAADGLVVLERIDGVAVGVKDGLDAENDANVPCP